MSLDLRNFKETSDAEMKEVRSVQRRYRKARMSRDKKLEGTRKSWEGSYDDLMYRKKMEGRCFTCIFWKWRFGDKGGTIKRCPIRKCEVAGYMKCKGYYRTRL